MSNPHLHPNYPIVEGTYQATTDWAIRLPEPMNRRIDDGDLVLWRPGLTVWIAAWNNDHREPPTVQRQQVRAEINPDARDITETNAGSIVALSYRLTEQHDRGPVEALYSFTFADCGHLQIAFYFDKPADLAVAARMHEQVTLVAPD